MIFSPKTDNYKTFEIYKDNVLTPRAYFIPFSSADKALKADIRNERYTSDKVTLLNGEWNFSYFGKVSLMPDEIDTDVFNFDKVNVPSMWQFTGYEKPYYLNTRDQFKTDPPNFPTDCPVGVYHRELYLESKKSSCIITFLGVAGAFDLFVNGKYIGYSEGSHNTSEFDVSDILKEGKNDIAVTVHKWSNSTYLECQDMFRNNGIFRDILLTQQDGDYIYDFYAKPVFNSDGTYDLVTDITLRIKSGSILTASLVSDGGETVASEKVASKEKITVTFKNLKVEEWNAERPRLYDLVLTLENENGIFEAVRRKTGFKHIEIKGNVFYFNNRKIKLLGVNHHDTDPKEGYRMTVENMERDVRTFKRYNMNCVRTSHYPPDPTFLDLCDEYGIYIIDEADIECHGVANTIGKWGACSDNPAWRGHYWDRVERMFQRDKNHPGITMWSLGNESHGISNHDYCYANLKKVTPIPVHYEAACRTKRWAYDVISQMYTHQSIVRKIGKGKGLPKKFYKKPYFLCEYAHAMGVGAGETEEYIREFLNCDNLLGGCVWEFADHAVYHENGEYKYTYGGDHGEEKHDGNFCVDGLFFPDRTPHSGALQIKNCYRPVRASLVSRTGKTAKVKFKSIKIFEAECLTVRWSAVSIYGSLKGEFDLSVKPGEEKEVSVDLCENCDAVVFEYFRGDTEIAKEQIKLGVTLKNNVNISKTAPVVKNSENNLIIEFENGHAVFNTKTGYIESYILGGKELINSASYGNPAFSVSIFRAPLDNDRPFEWVWNKYMLNTEYTKLISSKPYRQNSDAVIIENEYSVSTVNIKKLLKVKIAYTFYGDGSFRICMDCVNSGKILFCPRFGLTVEMPRKFDNVRYFGLGDRENLADFKEHAVLGEYSCKVDEMREKYIKPQESSTRGSVRWFSVTDDSGCGFEFDAVKKPFYFGADHFTSYQCAKAKHQEDLKLCDTTVLHIDEYVLGVGSGSCGPFTNKKYTKNGLKGEQLEFIIRPISGK